MGFILKCEICDQIIKSDTFWIHKLYCRNFGFKKTKFIASKQNLLKIFGCQSEVLMRCFERALDGCKERVKSGSLYRVTTTDRHVEIFFNATVYTDNIFEAKILDLGLADHLHTSLGNDLSLFKKSKSTLG